MFRVAVYHLSSALLFVLTFIFPLFLRPRSALEYDANVEGHLSTEVSLTVLDTIELLVQVSVYSKPVSGNEEQVTSTSTRPANQPQKQYVKVRVS